MQWMLILFENKKQQWIICKHKEKEKIHNDYTIANANLTLNIRIVKMCDKWLITKSFWSEKQKKIKCEI